MKFLRVVLCVFILLALVRFSWAVESPADERDGLSATVGLLPQHQSSGEVGPKYSLDEIEAMALTGNPEIRVASIKLAVVRARVPSAGALDDPAFMYRGWQVPLSQPWNYNAAQNITRTGLDSSRGLAILLSACSIIFFFVGGIVVAATRAGGSFNVLRRTGV